MRSFAVATLMLLLLSACAEGTDDVAVTTTLQDVDVGASTTSTSPVQTTTTTMATTTTEATTTTFPGTLIRVGVDAGEVTVNGSTTVQLGERVRIRVRSDVEDLVVVTTYDVTAEVTPDAVGVVTFTADEPGTFQVELQDSGTPLFELEVTE